MWPGAGLGVLGLSEDDDINVSAYMYVQRFSMLLGLGHSGSGEMVVGFNAKNTPQLRGVCFSYRKEVGRWLALCGKFRKTTQVGTHLGGKKENHHRTAAQM